jgi:hypothetical protein
MVASLMPKRSSPVLGMVSIVESQSTLSQRIDHILSRPVPKHAGLAPWGIVALIGVAALLVPMYRVSMPPIRIDLDGLDGPSPFPLATENPLNAGPVSGSANNSS